MKNYVDVKVTIWNRIYFEDNTDMEKIIDTIKQEGLESIYDDNLGFIENSSLHETEERITPEENAGSATIEVYKSEAIIWSNELSVKKE